MENGAYVSKGTRVGILPGHLRELHPVHELRSSAELWVMAVPHPDPDPAAEPDPEDSTTGTCVPSVSSPRTQGASTAPTRGPKQRREQIFTNNWTQLGAPCSYQNLCWKPKTYDRIQRSSSGKHPSIHACTQHKSTDTGTNCCTPPLLGLRAGVGRAFPQSLLPLSPLLLPKGRTLNYEKSAKERNPRSKAPGNTPLVHVSVPLPHLHRPQLRGRRGQGGARGRVLHCQNKAHGGIPQPCTEPVTKASVLSDLIR
ncbi:uncharacterized protein [Desmodus rotundus]|uniref:uncharacterized protein n=1 Tax=Desmodus rotundus TaxID=9430 RepID=UPI0023811DBC|nr:uncharacterized protein LOC123480877 [Desmodus rotundus]